MSRLLPMALILALAAPASADPCDAQALKLGAGKPLPAWTPSAGCTLAGGERPALIDSDAALRAKLTCKDPKAPLGVNFAKNVIVAVARSFSPATIGLVVFDDGKTVTLVSKQRKPCPGEYPPMPTPATTRAFLAAKGPRMFAEASCTVEIACPK